MVLLRLLSYLPFPALYFLSDIFFFLTYYIVRYRRPLVYRNLKNAFPEATDEFVESTSKKFYRNLCDYGIETLKLLTISEEEIKKRMVFKNTELIDQFVKENQSILFLTSHQFNWEWSLASGCLSLPLPVDFVYQQQSSKFFNNFSLAIRTRFGGYPILRSEVARESIKRREVLRAIAIMADQFPGHSHDKKYWTQFMNQRTAFYQGLGQLGYLTQYPTLFFALRKIKRGYYEAEAFLVAQPPYQKDSAAIVEGYIKGVERIIKEQPEGWLWSHNRWKNRE